MLAVSTGACEGDGARRGPRTRRVHLPPPLARGGTGLRQPLPPGRGAGCLRGAGRAGVAAPSTPLPPPLAQARPTAVPAWGRPAERSRRRPNRERVSRSGLRGRGITRRDLKNLIDGAQVALLGPSRRLLCQGCRAPGPQPRAARTPHHPPSLPPDAGRRCQAGREQCGATSCFATPCSRPCPGHGAGACAAPPPTHSPHPFPVHAVRRSARAGLSKGELPGPGGRCPSPFCLLPRSAPGPRRRGQCAPPRGSPRTG